MKNFGGKRLQCWLRLSVVVVVAQLVPANSPQLGSRWDVEAL